MAQPNLGEGETVIRSAVAVLCLILTGLTALAQEGRIVREMIEVPSLEGNWRDTMEVMVSQYRETGGM